MTSPVGFRKQISKRLEMLAHLATKTPKATTDNGERMKKLISTHLLFAALISAQAVQAADLDSGNMLNQILDSFSAVAIT